MVTYAFPEWELTNETKKIGEFICYKTLGNSKSNSDKERYEVWFTPQIPIQFGPILYNGLPGLVLEVQVGKIKVLASKIKLNPEQAIIIEQPKVSK